MVLTVATVSSLTEYRTEGLNGKSEDVVGVSLATNCVCTQMCRRFDALNYGSVYLSCCGSFVWKR